MAAKWARWGHFFADSSSKRADYEDGALFGCRKRRGWYFVAGPAGIPTRRVERKPGDIRFVLMKTSIWEIFFCRDSQQGPH